MQKTDWFQTPLNLKSIQDYLVQDIEILHPLLNHGSTKWTRTYINLWRWEKHTLFFVSYVSDQKFIPCFLKMHLRGVSVSIDNMYQTPRYIALQCEQFRINGRALSSSIRPWDERQSAVYTFSTVRVPQCTRSFLHLVKNRQEKTRGRKIFITH